jgi:hypothetical protein
LIPIEGIIGGITAMPSTHKAGLLLFSLLFRTAKHENEFLKYK